MNKTTKVVERKNEQGEAGFVAAAVWGGSIVEQSEWAPTKSGARKSLRRNLEAAGLITEGN